MDDLERSFLKLMDCWKRLDKGVPFLSWDSYDGFNISDSQGNIYSSADSIQSAIELAIEFSNEDLNERKRELLSQAQSLIARANSL